MRTVTDWLRDARDAGAAADVERCLDAAAALADDSYDWQLILAALHELPVVAPERVAELSTRTLEFAQEQVDVTCIAEVAKVRKDLLDDEAGARQVLRDCEQTLRRPHSRASEWVQLANGYRCVLGDVSAARRCLDAGRWAALRRRDSDDLVKIAEPLDRLGERSAALAVVAEAEALVVAHRPRKPLSEVFAIRSIVWAWHELGEHARGQRLLADATTRTRTMESALLLASMGHAWGDGLGLERALARAAELAASAGDWLEIAKESRDMDRGEAAVRAALDRAAELVVDDDLLRERVAAGYHHWLGEDRLGPRGVVPEQLRVVRRSLPGWRATPTPLFEWLRSRVTPETLDSIAHNDHDPAHADNLAALLDIWTTGLVPRALQWIPREVLELGSFARGDDVDHVERSWCCVLLALNDKNLGHVAAALVDSCLALGAPAPELAEQLLAWICRTMDAEPHHGNDYAPAHFALLLLRAAEDPADARVATLASMIVESEPDYFYKRSFMADQWDDLASRILAPLRSSRPDIDDLLDMLAT